MYANFDECNKMGFYTFCINRAELHSALWFTPIKFSVAKRQKERRYVISPASVVLFSHVARTLNDSAISYHIGIMREYTKPNVRILFGIRVVCSGQGNCRRGLLYIFRGVCFVLALGSCAGSSVLLCERQSHFMYSSLCQLTCGSGKTRTTEQPNNEVCVFLGCICVYRV